VARLDEILSLGSAGNGTSSERRDVLAVWPVRPTHHILQASASDPTTFSSPTPTTPNYSITTLPHHALSLEMFVSKELLAVVVIDSDRQDSAIASSKQALELLHWQPRAGILPLAADLLL
jgi:hypothetical protein